MSVLHSSKELQGYVRTVSGESGESHCDTRIADMLQLLQCSGESLGQPSFKNRFRLMERLQCLQVTRTYLKIARRGAAGLKWSHAAHHGRAMGAD